MILVTNRTGATLSIGSKLIASNSSVTFTDAETMAPGFYAELEPLLASGAVTTTATSANVVSYSGAGPHILPAGTMIAYIDPQGGAASVVAPPVSGAGTGSLLLVIQTGDGTIPLTAANTDKLFVGTATYTLAQRGASLSLRSDLPSSWVMVSRIGAPLVFECYVNSATGSDGNVGTLASPVATIEESVKRAFATQWLTTGTSYVAAGNYDPESISIPSGIGPDAQPFEIIGDLALATSTGTVASATAGSTSAPVIPMKVTVVTPVVASAHVGSLMRFTSGALNSTSVGIFDNTTTEFTSFKYATGVPTGGDTFAIDSLPVTLTANLSIQAGTGSRISLSRMNITGAILFGQECFIQWDRVHRVGSSFFQQNTQMSTKGAEYGIIFSSTDPGVFGAAVDVDTTSMIGVGLRGASVQAFRGATTLFAVLANNRSRITLSSSGNYITRLYTAGVTVSGGTHFLDVVRGSCDISSVNINNVVGGGAIASSAGGNITLNSATGTGNAGAAVRTLSAGKIQVVGPTTTVTITGASDCQVGSNTPATWADILANDKANTTDLAHVNSQMCRIGV